MLAQFNGPIPGCRCSTLLAFRKNNKMKKTSEEVLN